MEIDNSEKRISKITKWIEGHLVYSILIGVAVIFVSEVIFTRPACVSWLDFSDKGGVGETIGGIAAPIIGLLGIFLVYFTFTEQRKANEKQGEANKIQSDILNEQRTARQKIVCECTKNLELFPKPPEGGVTHGIQQLCVVNNSDHPIRNLKAQITMSYDLNDVLDGDTVLDRDIIQIGCYLGRDNVVPCIAETICWAEPENEKYHPLKDIYSNDVQNLSLFRFQKDVSAVSANQPRPASKNQMEKLNVVAVASFQGFGVLDRKDFKDFKARVLLRDKKYLFWIKLVSEDTKARVWGFELSDNHEVKPIRGDITIEQLRLIENRIRNREVITTEPLNS